MTTGKNLRCEPFGMPEGRRICFVASLKKSLWWTWGFCNVSLCPAQSYALIHRRQVWLRILPKATDIGSPAPEGHQEGQQSAVPTRFWVSLFLFLSAEWHADEIGFQLLHNLAPTVWEVNVRKAQMISRSPFQPHCFWKRLKMFHFLFKNIIKKLRFKK